MSIKGNTVGTNMPRANWDQTDPAKADYIKGKKTVEDLINKRLPKTGGEMTGSVAMGGNKVTGLGAPTDNGDAANKEYVDSKHINCSSELTVDGWTGDAAPYTQSIAVASILETDKPHITPVYADELETKLAQREAWNMVCEAESADGSITFTCFEDKPATAIPVQIEVNR